MSDDALQQSLNRLRAELTQLGSLGAEKDQKVKVLLKHIDKLSQQGGEPSEESLQTLLTEAVTAFEASHPTLTSLMNDIASLLSSIGI